MNEKIKPFYFIAVFIAVLYVTGCATTRVAADESVFEHQRRIAELEGRVLDYERRISEFDNLIGGTVSRLEAIRSRAVGIPDRIDRIVFLFDEYEREIERLIRENNYPGGAASTEPPS